MRQVRKWFEAHICNLLKPSCDIRAPVVALFIATRLCRAAVPLLKKFTSAAACRSRRSKLEKLCASWTSAFIVATHPYGSISTAPGEVGG